MSTSQNLSELYEVSTSLMSNKTHLYNITINPLELAAVKVIIIVIYVFVSLLCIFGNAIVLYVLTRSTQIISRTNLFLANLAFADLCVGVICVLPSLFYILTNHWYFGQALCKISKFVENTNITASVLLQEIIAIERYIAINYPLKSRHLFSQYKLYFAQLIVWLVSCVYNIPHLIAWDTYDNKGTNVTVTRCMFSYEYSKFQQNYVFCNFVVWYVIPLSVMTILYCQISRTLWESNVPTTMKKLRKRLSSVASSNISEDNGEVTASTSTCRQMSDSTVQSDGTMQDDVDSNQPKDYIASFQNRQNCKVDFMHVTNEALKWHKRNDFGALLHKETRLGQDKRQTNTIGAQCYSSSESESEGNVSNNGHNKITKTNDTLQTKVTCKPSDSWIISMENGERKQLQISGTATHYRVTSQRTSSRRRVIRLLIAILVVFAILVLPNHLRLIIYAVTAVPISEAMILIPPICQFLMYLNSAMNPILYSILSQSFRRCIKESLTRCLYKK